MGIGQTPPQHRRANVRCQGPFSGHLCDGGTTRAEVERSTPHTSSTAKRICTMSHMNPFSLTETPPGCGSLANERSRSQTKPGAFKHANRTGQAPGPLGPLERGHADVNERSVAQMVISSGMLCIRPGEDKKALGAHVSGWNWLCRVCLTAHQEDK